LANRVIIEDYDPRWPRIFEMLRSRIAIVLERVADSIDHVGSTAVPGLAAKPVIDIDVVLGSASDLPVAIGRLADLGYRGDLGVIGREAFRAMPDNFAHHLYVCPPDSREYRRHIAFRDHLRAHTDDANAYASLKRTLAIQFGTDREGYNQAKSKFVEGILERTLKA
jgi:GrpB-like predicted nucleotidyltransferase (UPF0157 family)